jgi:hypothetical protein
MTCSPDTGTGDPAARNRSSANDAQTGRPAASAPPPGTLVRHSPTSSARPADVGQTGRHNVDPHVHCGQKPLRIASLIVPDRASRSPRRQQLRSSLVRRDIPVPAFRIAPTSTSPSAGRTLGSSLQCTPGLPRPVGQRPPEDHC